MINEAIGDVIPDLISATFDTTNHNNGMVSSRLEHIILLPIKRRLAASFMAFEATLCDNIISQY